jgi:hypothetical protein
LFSSKANQYVTLDKTSVRIMPNFLAFAIITTVSEMTRRSMTTCVGIHASHWLHTHLSVATIPMNHDAVINNRTQAKTMVTHFIVLE